MSSGPSTPPAPQMPGQPGNGYIQPGSPAGNASAFPSYQAGYAPIGRAPISGANIMPYQQALTPEQIKAGLGKLDNGMGMAQQNFNTLGRQGQQMGQQARAICSRMGQMSDMFGQNARNAGNAAYNPAIGAYQQALQQNSQNIGAQLASQRGSSVNPGLAARNVGQQGAMAAQGAAGQMSSQVAAYKQANQQAQANNEGQRGQLTNQAYGLQNQAYGMQGQAAGMYGNMANAYAQAGLANQGQMLNALAAQNAAQVAMQSNINSSQVAMQSNINNAGVAMQSNINDVMSNQMMNNNRLGTEQYGMGLNYNASIYGDQTQASSAQNQNYQNNGLLGLPIPILSDERAKKNIKPAGDKIDRFLRALSAKEYNYKNPKEPGAAKGRHVSPMAQELEKTELGKNMVVNNGGRKMVDYQRGLGTILAAQARLNQRLDSVEKVQKFAKGGMVKPKKFAEGGFTVDPGLDEKLSEMGGSSGPSNGLQSGGNSPFNLGVNTDFGEQAGIPKDPNGPKSVLGQIMGGMANRQIGQTSGGGGGGGSTFGQLSKMGLAALLANKGGMATHQGMIRPGYAQGGQIQPDTMNPNYQPPLSQMPPQSPQIASPNQSMQPQGGPQGPQGPMGPGRPPQMGQAMGQGPSMPNFALAGSPNPQVAMPSTGLPMGNAQTRGGAPMPGMGMSGGSQPRPQQPGMARGGRVPYGRQR